MNYCCQRRIDPVSLSRRADWLPRALKGRSCIHFNWRACPLPLEQAADSGLVGGGSLSYCKPLDLLSFLLQFQHLVPGKSRKLGFSS